MDLHGSLSDNLQAALKSATRHRNLAVYSDTRDYWDRLLHYAQSLPGDEDTMSEISELARKLALELIERDRRTAITSLS